MPRHVLAAALALLVSSTGFSPCAATAIARAPARSSPHAAPAEGPTGAGSRHEPATSIAARCDCRCTGDAPHAVVSSLVPVWAVPATPAPPPPPAATAPAAEPCVRAASAALARIDHVPIAPDQR